MTILSITLDGILVAILIEGIVLQALLRRHGRSPFILPLWLFLGSGAGLIASFRLHLTGAVWPVVGAALLVSGLLHAVCLAAMLRRTKKGG